MSAAMLPTAAYLRTEKSGAVLIDVHVVVNAARTHADGVHDQALRMRLHAPPVDGKANKYLVEILSSHFGVAKSRIKILKGETSSFKIIEIEN